MPSAESELQTERRQLERVLASPGFARNERLARFLRFVVEQHLEGRDDEIKESVLAVQVFGRSPDHNPRQVSIVRTEAGRLRARLNEYYLGEGKDDALVIELPKGGYVPLFRRTASTPEAAAPPQDRKAPKLGRAWLVAGIACIVAATALGWWRFGPRNAPIPIAVLPLIDLSEDPANDYVADGLTFEIIHDLSIIDGLEVRSQTSSFVFKGKAQNVRDAGKLLGVDYILEGNSLHAGQRVRMNVQLVRVRDDFPVWSDQYDCELTDRLAVQDEISRGIVNSLRVKLGRGRRRYETSTEASELYLRARAFEIQNFSGGRNYNTSFYEQAIKTDASFAPAYAGLAAAYAYRTGEDRFNSWAAGTSREEEISKMHQFAQEAFKLDPSSAEVDAALGMVQARDAQWEQSEKSFKSALELEPGRSPTHVDYAFSLLMPLGRSEEALAQVRLAAKNDPLNPSVQEALSYALFSAGRLDEAAKHCSCARGLILQGKPAEAIPILEAQFNGRLPAMGSQQLGVAYALAGRRPEAETIAKIQPRPIEQATIFVALGDKDRAFQALNRAVDAGLGPVRIGRNLYYPEFAPLRGDPRLKALRERLGLPEH